MNAGLGSTMKGAMIVLGTALVLGVSGAGVSAQTLKTVKDRGSLICGVS